MNLRFLMIWLAIAGPLVTHQVSATSDFAPKALRKALKTGDTRLLEQFINNGSFDVTMPYKEDPAPPRPAKYTGCTLLHAAAAHATTRTLSMLCQVPGADLALTRENTSRNTPLLIAILNGRSLNAIALIKECLAKSISLDTRLHNGATAFLACAILGNWQVAQALVDAHVNTRATDNDGDNAFHCAVQSSDNTDDFIEWLATLPEEQRPDISAPNDKHLTPIDIAYLQGKGKRRIATILSEAGAVHSEDCAAFAARRREQAARLPATTTEVVSDVGS